MIVIVSPEETARCREHGERIVASYKAGRSPRSKEVGIVDGLDPIWNDPVEQAFGKVWEVAFCKALNRPLNYLSWSDGADPGYDIEVGWRKVDVKGSKDTNARYFIWPKGKASFLGQTLATHFVFVRRMTGDLVSDIKANVGWAIAAPAFVKHHHLSTADEPLLEGTPCLRLDHPAWRSPEELVRLMSEPLLDFGDGRGLRSIKWTAARAIAEDKVMEYVTWQI